VATVPQPFGLSYYCDLNLLSDLSIAAQVLGMLHERFIHQLADFLKRADGRDTHPQQEGTTGVLSGHDRRGCGTR
jgi:hypothetical protein